VSYTFFYNISACETFVHYVYAEISCYCWSQLDKIILHLPSYDLNFRNAIQKTRHLAVRFS
jgi:hypothetical protein